MKNSLGENQSDSDFKSDEVCDYSEEDYTSLTVIENISKATENHGKKMICYRWREFRLILLPSSLNIQI